MPIAITPLAVLLAASPPEVVGVDDLARHLEAIEASARSLRSTFTATSLKPRVLEPGTPWPAHGWDDDPPISRFRYDWATHDGLVRVVCLYTSDVGEHPSFPRLEETTDVWNGSEWIRRAVGRHPISGDREVNWKIQARPQATPPADCVSLFCGGARWVSILGAHTPSQIARTYDLVERTVEDDVVRFRFSAPTLPSKQVVLTVSTTPRLSLASITTEFIGEDGKVTLRIGFYVDAWGEHNGALLPRRAHRVGASLVRPEGGTVTAWCTVFERMEAAALDDEEAAALLRSPPFDEGDLVHDLPRKLAYYIGGRRLYIDGVGLELAEPIRARLVDLSGLPLDEAPPVGAAAGPDGRSPQ